MVQACKLRLSIAHSLPLQNTGWLASGRPTLLPNGLPAAPAISHSAQIGKSGREVREKTMYTQTKSQHKELRELKQSMTKSTKDMLKRHHLKSLKSYRTKMNKSGSCLLRKASFVNTNLMKILLTVNQRRNIVC